MGSGSVYGRRHLSRVVTHPHTVVDRPAIPCHRIDVHDRRLNALG